MCPSRSLFRLIVLILECILPWKQCEKIPRTIIIIALIVLCRLSGYGSVLIPWLVQSATIKTISNENTHSFACRDIDPAILKMLFLALLPNLKLTWPQFNRRCCVVFSLFFWTPSDLLFIHYMVKTHHWGPYSIWYL